MDKEMLKIMEKKPQHSKKFIAWLIQQLLMTCMAMYALHTQQALGWPLASFMAGIIFMMGISTMWYLGKQAAVDAAVRGYTKVTRGIDKHTDKED